jgi:C4-dicarboxylate-specific signal transduction histidine kinase
MSFLGRQLSAHGITVQTGLDEKLPRVFGTQSGYEEVVLNLLTNAMHALDAIDNREKELTIRTFRTGDKVVLEVDDNATGIRDEIIEEIFEPLFSTKKHGEGMGLGLAIVQSLVERFNGRIEAQNKIQGGATLRVELPVAL